MEVALSFSPGKVEPRVQLKRGGLTHLEDTAILLAIINFPGETIAKLQNWCLLKNQLALHMVQCGKGEKHTHTKTVPLTPG